ncbi:hypothetical protein [Haloarchaeobius sp. HRN-SO-5]|uniref:hypothetical protein n=1 Tax=Haloarchaeobius sp. HRN-SO-5 TaxID=3446118 RepID=UPI003EBE9C97
MTDEDRRVGMSRLRYGFVALVGASGALVAFHAGAPLEFIVGGLVGGLLAGALLWWFLVVTFETER